MSHFFQKIINSLFNVSSVFAQTASEGLPSFNIESPVPVVGLEGILASIIGFVTTIMFIIAPVMYLWAGFQYLTSAGDDKKIKSAKDTLIWTTIGVLIILMAEGITYIVRGLLTP